MRACVGIPDTRIPAPLELNAPAPRAPPPPLTSPPLHPPPTPPPIPPIHAGLNESHFDAVAIHLMEAMQEVGVPGDDVMEALTLVESTRRIIFPLPAEQGDDSSADASAAQEMQA